MGLLTDPSSRGPYIIHYGVGWLWGLMNLRPCGDIDGRRAGSTPQQQRQQQQGGKH